MSLVLDAVRRTAQRTPEQAAVAGGGVSLDWRRLRDEIAAAAAWLEQATRAAPLRAPVAVLMDNGPAWVVIDLALVSLGRPSLPLPPFFTPEQRRHALTDAGACLLVRAPATGEQPSTSVAGFPLTADRLGLPERPLPPGVAKITYTSGSTGTPKGVCLSLAQMEETAAALVARLGEGFAGRHLAVLPLGVLLENVAGLYASLIAGGLYEAQPLGSLGFGEQPAPRIARLADAIEEGGAGSVILVPELLRLLAGELARSRRRLASLRLVAVGGAKVSPQLLAMARAVGLPAYEGYGLSECASVVALNTPGDDRPGAVGRPLPHHRIRITADGGIAVGPSPFLGYVGAPPQTGELMTGDLGRLDEEGRLIVEGRRSNLLITAYGRNVSPEWVESELLGQPEIAQAAVFGEGAPELCALLVPSHPEVPGSILAAAVARANARLPAYARVGRWRRRGPFDPARGELTGNGRPRRSALEGNHADFIHQRSEALTT